MKKKFFSICLITIVMCLCLTGCGKKESSKSADSSNTTQTLSTTVKTELTIRDVLAEFENQGITVTLESKPYYTLIEANDGEMFYLDNDVVKLYEYKSIEDYNNAFEKYLSLQNMPHKGLVVLDTNSQTALNIFENIK